MHPASYPPKARVAGRPLYEKSWKKIIVFADAPRNALVQYVKLLAGSLSVAPGVVLRGGIHADLGARGKGKVR